MHVSTRPRPQLLTISLVLALVGSSVMAASPPTARGADGDLTVTAIGTRNVTQTSTEVTWTVSAPATGQVEFGPTTAYGQQSKPERSFNYTTHVQRLSGLTPGTVYHYRVRSTDQAGRTVVSGDHTFTTAGTSTAAPTPTPTPTPRPTPTPTPTPSPSSGLAAAPATTRTVSVPDTVTGSNLSSWIASVPDGSVIQFPQGKTYTVNPGIALKGRHDLVLVGNGSTIKAAGSGSQTASSPFYLNMGNTDIVIRDFILVGNTPTPGIFDGTQEFQHGLAVRGGSRIEISGVTISGVGGDGVRVSTTATNVWFHDSHVVDNGRMGVSVTSGSNVLVERVTLDKVGYGAFNIEPNNANQGGSTIRFLNNTVGEITLPSRNGFFFGANGAQGSIVSDVVVSGNTIRRDPLITYVNWTPRRDVTFTNNRSLTGGAGPVLRFRYVDGLVVRGNVQPLSSGELASITDSTNVVLEP